MDRNLMISAMTTAGFYKLTDRLHYAANSVYAPNYTLLASDHETYLYPLHGWYWFDSYEEAEAFFNINGASNADWLGFAGWLYQYPPIMAGMNAARQSTDPQGEPATTGLPAAMDEARLRQNYPAFALSWGQFLMASGLAAESISAIVAKAQACNLPAEFIQALEPI
jgi:hypothetical protein